MNRRKRTEILIRGSREISKSFSCEIAEKYSIEVIDKPKECLVMLKVREGAEKSLFYLGEALAVESRVYINGNLGLGVVLGDDYELAYDLAIIDAAYNSGAKEIDNWNEILTNEEINIKRIDLKRENEILKTKVNFSTMDVEY